MAQLKMWKFQPSTSTTDVGNYYNSTQPLDIELFSTHTPLTGDESGTNALWTANSGALLAKLPNYNSVSIQKYFPKKVGHTLMNGGFVTFTPNTKHRITMQFSFLTAPQYEKILENYNNLVVIQPEFGTTPGHIPTSFKDSDRAKEFKVLWVDDAINFTYTDTYKGAGYSGTINWLEV